MPTISITKKLPIITSMQRLIIRQKVAITITIAIKRMTTTTTTKNLRR
jgi:hypothetical protein